MRLVLKTLLCLGLCAKSVFAGLSDYERSYKPLMMGKPPRLINAQQGIKFPDSIYLNRHLSEFSVVAWNFEPSKKPFHFREKIEPLEPQDLEHLQQTNTDGFIVVKQGKIIHEYYAEGMYKTTRHAAYSVSKSWISAIWSDALLPVMQKNVEEILPEMRGTVYEGYPVRSVVDMRVPVVWNLDVDDPKSSVNLAGMFTGWDFKKMGMSHLKLFRSLKKSSGIFEDNWHYASPNTLVLERIGLRVSGGHPYERMNRFYQKIGMEYMSSIAANFENETSSSGGVSYTLRDFVKLPFVMANEGLLGKKRIVKTEYIEDVFDSYEEKMVAWYSKILSVLTGDTLSYSNQWFVFDKNTAAGIGSFGQYILFNRKKNIAIAKFSTYPSNDPWMIAKDLFWLAQKIK